MIEFRDVSQKFGNRTVLHNINAELSERRIAIVGSNGSGKSTFARLINGLQLPTGGTVQIDGTDTRTDGKLVRRKVGFVFQNPDNQIVLPLVEEDLAFGLKNSGIDKDTISHEMDGLLDDYGLKDLRKHPTHLLSFGQKQLLAILGVIIMKPDYIVFDEPTTLLDLRNKNKIRKVIRDLGQTVVVISHDLDFLDDFDRVLVLSEGSIVADDCPSSALSKYVEMMQQ